MHENRDGPGTHPAERKGFAADDDFELTVAERGALARLPQEIDPGDLLEERVVRTLRRRGVLSKPLRRRGRAFWVTAAAAGTVLFLGGTVVGQWMGGRAAAHAVAAATEAESAAVQFVLQEIGSAYVSQLARLADMRVGESGDPVLLEQGREVGFATLFAATNELARLDPASAELEHVLELLRPLVQPRSATGEGSSQVFWF